MGDLTSKRVIIIKGWLFFAIAVIAALLIVQRSPRVVTVILVGTLAWSSCRFYFFLFYVLERYVDPGMKYRGVWHLYSQMRRAGPHDAKTGSEHLGGK